MPFTVQVTSYFSCRLMRYGLCDYCVQKKSKYFRVTSATVFWFEWFT